MTVSEKDVTELSDRIAAVGKKMRDTGDLVGGANEFAKVTNLSLEPVGTAAADNQAVERLCAACEGADTGSGAWWGRIALGWNGVGLVGLARTCLRCAREIVRSNSEKDVELIRQLATLSHDLDAAVAQTRRSAEQAKRSCANKEDHCRRLKSLLSTARENEGAVDAARPWCPEERDAIRLANQLIRARAEAASIELMQGLIASDFASPTAARSNRYAFFCLAEGLRSLGDGQSGHACYRIAAWLEGIEWRVGEENLKRDGLVAQLRMGLRDTWTDNLLAETPTVRINRVRSEFGDWCLEHQIPSVFADQLRQHLPLLPPSALSRYLGWLSVGLGWVPEFAFSESLRARSQDDALIATGRRPPPIALRSRLDTQPSAPVPIVLQRPHTLPGSEPPDRTMSIELGPSPGWADEPVQFGPGSPALFVAPSRHAIIAASAIRQLLDQGIAVLWIRAGSHRELAVPPCPSERVLQALGSGDDSNLLFRSWFVRCSQDSTVREALAAILSMGAPATVRQSVRHCLRETINAVAENGPFEPWSVVPSDLASQLLARLVRDRDTGMLTIAGLRILAVALGAAIDALLELLKALRGDTPDTSHGTPDLELGIVDLPEAQPRSQILAVLAVGALLASRVGSDVPLHARLVRRGGWERGADEWDEGERKAPPRRTALAGWGGANIEGDGRVCVALTGEFGPEMQQLARWFHAYGLGRHVAFMACCPKLPEDAENRAALRSFRAFVLPEMETQQRSRLRVATGLEMPTSVGSDDLVEFTMRDGCVHNRQLIVWPA